MIEWNLKFISSNSNEELTLDLTKQKTIDIKETDEVKFIVNMSFDAYEDFGTPSLLIGDLRFDLISSHSYEDRICFSSMEMGESSRFFYNCFGESPCYLVFKNSENYFFTLVNVLARKENAERASVMMNYIKNKLEDSVQVCFSKTRKGFSLDSEEAFDFTKVEIIKKSIKFFFDGYSELKYNRLFKIDEGLMESYYGQPTGPDSIKWLLDNLDKISPSNSENYNVIFNNRYYRSDKLPKEIIIENYDVYENRVLNSFFYSAENYLLSLSEKVKKYSRGGGLYASDSDEYLRFDHTMQIFFEAALNFKEKEIDDLIKKITKIREEYYKIIPSKYNKVFLPKITSKVNKKSFYFDAFHLITKFYKSPAPNFDSVEYLLGLKNLSVIYECCALLLIIEAFDSLGFKVIESSYRNYGESFGFKGAEHKRPVGEMNNYYVFEKEGYKINLLYEPKIYQLNSSTSNGDLINVSSNRRNDFGYHYYMPDFSLEFSSLNWNDSRFLILDAKYKTARTIKKFDLDDLSKKYFFNINQLVEDDFIGSSPIKMVIALFAQSDSGRAAHYISSNHSILSQRPALPQVLGIHLFPNETDLLIKAIDNFIKISDFENGNRYF